MKQLLDELPNGGAVVAIIAVVIIFLNKFEAIVSRFTAELSESRKDYVDHLDRLTERRMESKGSDGGRREDEHR